MAKTASKPEDDHEDGALATVLGSIKIPPELKFPFYDAKADEVPVLYALARRSAASLHHDDRLARVDK